MKKIISNTLIVLLMLGGTIAYAEEGGVIPGGGGVTEAPGSDTGKVVEGGETGGPTNTTTGAPKSAPVNFLQRLKNNLGIKTQEAKTKNREGVEAVMGEKGTKAKDIKDIKIQEKEKETKDLRNKMTNTTKETKGEAVKERVANIFDKTVSRLEATIVREESIMAKIVVRIEKVKTAGGKTIAAEGLVAEAKTHFALARTALDSLKTLIGASDVGVSGVASTSAMVRNEALSRLRGAGKEVEKHIREGHKVLQKTIGILKGVSQLHNATSTKEI